MSKKSTRLVPDDKPLTNNPFATLGALKETLPEGAPAAPASTPKAAAPTREPLAAVSKLVVRKERKGHGGKTVTLVQGLPGSLRETMADQMKKALGCGARVDGENVVLQGELVERAARWLAKHGARKVIEG